MGQHRCEAEAGNQQRSKLTTILMDLYTLSYQLSNPTGDKAKVSVYKDTVNTTVVRV